MGSCEKNDIIDHKYPAVKNMTVKDISRDGVVFEAEIIKNDKETITECGFIWGETKPILGISDQVVVKETRVLNYFKAEIQSTLSDGKIYYARAYAKTNDLDIYGQVVSFKSKGSRGPEIYSFSPQKGLLNDTICIRGNFFSYVKEHNLVKFGAAKSIVVSASDTLLKVLLPENTIGEQVKVNLTIADETATVEEPFTYLKPVPRDFSPQIASQGDILTIKGENMNINTDLYKVKFDGWFNAEIVSVSNTELKVKVPDRIIAKESRIDLYVGNQYFSLTKLFKLRAPEILSLSQKTIYKTGGELTIRGRYFSPLKECNTVYIDGVECEVKEASKEEITIEISENVIPQKYVSKVESVVVAVRVGEQYAYAPQELNIHWESAWTRLNDFPGTSRRMAVGFALDGYGYIGTGIPDEKHAELRDFWKYNPKSDSWTRIADLPGKARAGASVFVIDNKAYVGMGSENGFTHDMELYKDMYRFDPSLNRWTRLNDFPGSARSKAACFSNGRKGYVGVGYCGNGSQDNYNTLRDFWEYTPQSDSWVEITSFPKHTDMGKGFVIGDTSYVYDYGKLYKLENNEWIEIPAPHLGQWSYVCFSIADKGYFGLGSPHSSSSSEFYEWDSNTQENIRKDMDWNHKRSEAAVFVLDNKAYIIGGLIYSYYLKDIVCLRDVWVFDPSKPIN